MFMTMVVKNSTLILTRGCHALKIPLCVLQTVLTKVAFSRSSSRLEVAATTARHAEAHNPINPKKSFRVKRAFSECGTCD